MKRGTGHTVFTTQSATPAHAGTKSTSQCRFCCSIHELYRLRYRTADAFCVTTKRYRGSSISQSVEGKDVEIVRIRSDDNNADACNMRCREVQGKVKWCIICIDYQTTQRRCKAEVHCIGPKKRYLGQKVFTSDVYSIRLPDSNGVCKKKRATWVVFFLL